VRLNLRAPFSTHCTFCNCLRVSDASLTLESTNGFSFSFWQVAAAAAAIGSTKATPSGGVGGVGGGGGGGGSAVKRAPGLHVVGAGAGGVEEMQTHLDETTVQWGLLRFTIGSGTFQRAKVWYSPPLPNQWYSPPLPNQWYSPPLPNLPTASACNFCCCTHVRHAFIFPLVCQTPMTHKWAVCLFVFISSTMRFSGHGLGASSPLITTPQYQR
jgi:hypothetical protein